MTPASAVQRERARLERVYGGYGDATAGRWTETNPGNRAILAERLANAAALIMRSGRVPTERHRVLDVGCGTGGDLVHLNELLGGARLRAGIDLRLTALQAGAARPDLARILASATSLPFARASIDLVLVSTVFSSMLDQDIREHAAAEVERVLAPDGAVLWYDMRVSNRRNGAVRRVSRRELATLFEGFRLTSRRSTVVPGLARRLPPSFAGSLYYVLARMPLLKTHWSVLLERQ